jgi:diguanylate cyclase (GGDEF)-like protein
MPSTGSPAPAPMSPEDSFFELLAETLENMDRAGRGQFLQRFFKSIAQLDLTEPASLAYWEQIQDRRRELADIFGKPVSLKAAMIDILASSSYLRVPVLMEYDELKKLQINAATDALTGLYNRRLFEEQFDKELNRAMRYNQNLALVILDLHKFKEVNDRYGHPRGDLLLQTAAGTLRKSLRTSDYAFRIGGDEFALLLVQSDTEQGLTLARRIRANFAASIEPMQISLGLGFDYGVAVYPDDGDQKDVLIRVADERLYEMKQLNRAGRPHGQPGIARRTAPPMMTPAPAPLQSSAPSAASPPSVPVQTPAPSPVPIAAPAHSEKRKWERIALADTRAHAELTGSVTARVVDLGYGGVALEMNENEQTGSTFYAVLHVPILSPVRVNLKKVYEVRVAGGQVRVGCAFVT